MNQTDLNASVNDDAGVEDPETEGDPPHRRAIARATVTMEPATVTKVASNGIVKGDVLGCARIAGIQASKRAADLIPTVLPAAVGGVIVSFELATARIDVEAIVEAYDRTSVSMQAMTACAVAALTIYDMCKAVDRSMVIGALALWEETAGGSSGWHRTPAEERSPTL